MLKVLIYYSYIFHLILCYDYLCLVYKQTVEMHLVGKYQYMNMISALKFPLFITTSTLSTVHYQPSRDSKLL